jgi:hypothetical protein
MVLRCKNGANDISSLGVSGLDDDDGHAYVRDPIAMQCVSGNP